MVRKTVTARLNRLPPRKAPTISLSTKQQNSIIENYPMLDPR